MLKRAEGRLASLDGPLVNVKVSKQWAPIVFPDFRAHGSRPPDPQEVDDTGEPSSCPTIVDKAKGDKAKQGDVVETFGGTTGEANAAMGKVIGMTRKKMASFYSNSQ